MARILQHITLLVALLLGVVLFASATAPPAPTPAAQLAQVKRQLSSLTQSPFPGISVNTDGASVSFPVAPGVNFTLSVTPTGTFVTPEPTENVASLWQGSSGAAVYCALVAIALIISR